MVARDYYNVAITGTNQFFLLNIINWCVPLKWLSRIIKRWLPSSRNSATSVHRPYLVVQLNYIGE